MPTRRLGSIDVIRALTMYFMVFVNDLWTDKDIPAWLEHAPGKADAMGFADIIFPAFLFIVGAKQTGVACGVQNDERNFRFAGHSARRH